MTVARGWDRGPVGLFAAALLAAGLTACAVTADAGGSTDERPNIVLINLDDVNELMIDWRRPDGAYVMPAVQELKERSTTYPDTLVVVPSCCESRSATFTGRYPHNNGVLHQSDGQLLDVDATFARYLREQGYATAMAGKFLTSWPLISSPPDWQQFSMIGGGYVNPVINRNGDIERRRGYSTTLLMDDLRTYVTEMDAADDDRPWLAMWTPQAAHIAGTWKSLATPERRYADVAMGRCVQKGEADRSDKPAHVRWVEPDPAYVQQLCTSQLQTMISVDDQVARLLASIDSLGERDRTMIILQSDNGQHWNENGFFAKYMPYEASIQVPLVIHWPGQETGATDRRTTSTLDVTATILDLAGASPDPAKPLDGRSLTESPDGRLSFSEYFYDDANGDIWTWAGLRHPRWKYVEVERGPDQGRDVEYYRLDRDPHEWLNVMGDDDPSNDLSPGRLAELAAQLQAARACAAASCP